MNYFSVEGTLMGITNTVATIPGIVVPIIVGQLTNTNVCMPACFVN
jgi:hypothetical protein